jgi:hypothetical protein
MYRKDEMQICNMQLSAYNKKKYDLLFSFFAQKKWLTHSIQWDPPVGLIVFFHMSVISVQSVFVLMSSSVE